MRALFAAALLATSSIVLPALATPASAQAAPEAPTYAEVLARPDDIRLNFAYAMKLVREGHLNAAQAALERLLLSHPEADDVRVTYMIVLFRIDDIAGAKREADILASRNLSGRIAAEYERYNSQIQSRAKTTRITTYLGTGLRYDSDASLANDDVQKKRDGDVSLISLAGFGIEHDVDFGVIDKVFANFDIGSATHFDQTDYSLFLGRAEAGFDSRISFLTLRLAGLAEGSIVGGEAFSKAVGGKAVLTAEVTSALKLFADAQTLNTTYDEVKVAPDANQYSGPSWRVGGGLSYMVTESHQLTLQSHFTRKNAKTDDFGLQSHDYDSTDIEGKWLGTFSGGQFAATTLRYAWTNYDDYDWYSEATRRDHLFRVRATYGVPVDTLGHWMGIDTNNAFVNWGRLVVQTSVDYINQDSNISTFDYHSLGGEILLTRRWHF